MRQSEIVNLSNDATRRERERERIEQRNRIFAAMREHAARANYRTSHPKGRRPN